VAGSRCYYRPTTPCLRHEQKLASLAVWAETVSAPGVFFNAHLPLLLTSPCVLLASSQPGSNTTGEGLVYPLATVQRLVAGGNAFHRAEMSARAAHAASSRKPIISDTYRLRAALMAWWTQALMAGWTLMAWELSRPGGLLAWVTTRVQHNTSRGQAAWPTCPPHEMMLSQKKATTLLPAAAACASTARAAAAPSRFTPLRAAS
jgi:hypothetical protein